jgi:ubiquinone/menaquinone biosynthesis C-methylase UbiE
MAPRRDTDGTAGMTSSQTPTGAHGPGRRGRPRRGASLARAAYALGQTARVGVYLGQYVLSARLTTPVEPKRPLQDAGSFPGLQEVLADLRALLERDWANVEAGVYRMPHDLLEEPVAALRRARRYFRELQRVERRRHGRGYDEVLKREEAARLRAAYPRYYLQNFHFQSDGWLSEDSAAIYDHQVEVLFSGGADAMRRQALVPLAEVMRTRRAAETRLIDVASGTGRFLTFVKDNYPRLPVTALDLSPDYLAQAARNLRPWRGVETVQAAAEETGLPDAGFDLATCIFLFHELPPRVRPRAAAEIARILKPGGRLLFVDSIQAGDHPPFDALLQRFPVAFHEPYYGSYTTTDLEALFAAAGLKTLSVERAFFSRVMVLEKAG